MHQREIFVSFVLLSSLSPAVGCSKAQTDTGKVGQGAPIAGDQAFVETQPTGSVAWNVRPSGEVQAALRTKDGQPLPGPVTGTMQWTAPGQEPQTIPVAYADGTLTATGPKLAADVTEVKYAIDADGTPWTGVLHLPPGGTPEIVADATLAMKIQVPTGKVGPHGGRIQVVGPDRLELVSNAPTGEVRVYVLDANYAPVAVENRHVTLGVAAERSEVVDLEPDPGGLYFAAVWGVNVDPWRLDATMRVGPSVYFGVWGYTPGLPLFVGPAAPRYAVRLATGWGPPTIRGHVLVSSPRVDLVFRGPRGGFRGAAEVGGEIRGDGVRREEVRVDRHGEGRGEPALSGGAPRGEAAEGRHASGGGGPAREPARTEGHRR
jgi:hypothetical protein